MSITSRLERDAHLARRERRLGRERSRLARWLLGRVLRWQELARQRRALLELDDRMLKDIGISRLDALREYRRPFWDDAGRTWRDD